MRRRSVERGTVVVASLSLVVLLGSLGSAMLIRSLHESHIGHRSTARQRAFFLAEAGVDQASFNLQTPTDLTDDLTAGTFVTGTYQLESPPVPLGNNRWQVIAHGFSQQEHRRMEAVFQLTPQSLFQFALFGDQLVNVSGSVLTDSYDSRAGLYENDPDSPDYNLGHEGDVGTNATATGSIRMDGTSLFVDGQLVVGPNVADPASIITGFEPALVTGGTDPPSDTQDVVSAPREFPMPAVQVPVGLSCSDVTVAGPPVTLSPAGGENGDGVYCYHDLTVNGGGVLTASGPVTVYLTGQLRARGNSNVGVLSDPSQMLFLMTSSAEATLEEGTITGSTVFAGAIYGPDATIYIDGTTELFGSVIADSVDVAGNAIIHYDEGLESLTRDIDWYTTALISWRELDD